MTRQRAFTLVEILVVLIITTVLASFIILSLRDSGKDYFLRDDLSRLAALLEMNCRDALVTGQHIGIRVGDEGYDVFRHDGVEWIDISAESVIYRHRSWSDEWVLQLEFQGRDALIREGEDTPQLICLGSGELLPFRLALLGGPNMSLALTGHPDRQLIIEPNR